MTQPPPVELPEPVRERFDPQESELEVGKEYGTTMADHETGEEIAATAIVKTHQEGDSETLEVYVLEVTPQ